jgi:hypothetical protein
MGIAHGRGDGARINCYTCFVPVYCPVGKAPDKHGNAAGEALPIDAKLDLLLKVARLEYDPLA